MTGRLITLAGLSVLAMFVVACGDGGLGASSDVPATISVPPTFVRIAVTPVATRTPVPTVPPTSTPQPGELRTGEPEFPLHLDPELVDVRPGDEVIFEGWTDYLTDTAVIHPGWETELHLCRDGIVMIDGGLHENFTNWHIRRSPAISFADWGKVAIEVEIIDGRWKGRLWDVLTLVRKGGKVFLTNNQQPGPLEVNRSNLCLTESSQQLSRGLLR